MRRCDGLAKEAKGAKQIRQNHYLKIVHDDPIINTSWIYVLIM